jgi:hypothetical protein
MSFPRSVSHCSCSTIAFAVDLPVFLGAGCLINRYEYQLIEAAERTLPGPLETIVAKKMVPPNG